MQVAQAGSDAKATGGASGSGDKPNIIVIWGDDIGQSNLSTYTDGLMGYQTPNIDRIADEGMKFTDYYAEQSCTAGRSAFITGQSVFRTGLSKVGLPGAKQGLQAEDPTIAQLLKNHGYATGQFGKNHLGDRNEFLPTVHGFDEFYGNLYHLNAEEEPEEVDYPKDPAFRAKYGPRGVMDCKVSTTDDSTVDPRFGKMGKQVCKDTGPLTRKRMVTIDDDIAARAQDFMRRQVKDGKPIAIQKFIGRRPIAAFGNSDGDIQMLQWTTSGPGRRLGMVVHHDDAEREYAYDRSSQIGTLDKALELAGPAGWTVVSIQKDWKTVFPAE